MANEKRINAGYIIVASARIGNREIVLGYNENAVNEWVTWSYNAERDEYSWGHYFTSENDCMDNYIKRIKLILHDEIFFQAAFGGVEE